MIFTNKSLIKSSHLIISSCQSHYGLHSNGRTKSVLSKYTSCNVYGSICGLKLPFIASHSTCDSFDSDILDTSRSGHGKAEL